MGPKGKRIFITGGGGFLGSHICERLVADNEITVFTNAARDALRYTLLGEQGMHRYSPWTVLFHAMVFAAVTWHVIYPPFHYLRAGFSPAQWGWIIYISVMGTILPFGLFFLGVNHIRSTRASITATVEPITAGLLAFFLLGEKLEMPQILGGTMVIGAIVVLQIWQEQDRMTPELIRAGRGGGDNGTKA